MAPKSQPKNARKTAGRQVAKIEKPRGGTGMVTSAAANKMREDAAKFKKGFQAKDMAVPFLRIVEKLSGLMKKTSSDYNPDAHEGDIFNSASEKLYNGEDGIYFIPCVYTRKFTRWGLIEKEGGFKADLGTEYDLAKHCKQDDKKHWICNDNKNEHVVESGDYFGLIADIGKGTAEQAIISMSGGRWGSAKKWNTLIAGLTIEDGEGGYLTGDDLPMFAECYLLQTRLTSADDFEWFVWDVSAFENTLNMKNGDSIYNLAKGFAAAVDEGKVKVAERAPEDINQQKQEDEAPPSRRNKR